MEDEPVRGFLERWSRLKREAAVEAGRPAELPDPGRSAPDPLATADMPSIELPPVESLNFESDYRAFLGGKVDESLKRAALGKLFHTEHFNTMDGLDVYIEDFSAFEPMTKSMVEQLVHARETLSPTLPEDWLKPAAAGGHPEMRGAADAIEPALPDSSDAEIPDDDVEVPAATPPVSDEESRFQSE